MKDVEQLQEKLCAVLIFAIDREHVKILLMLIPVKYDIQLIIFGEPIIGVSLDST